MSTYEPLPKWSDDPKAYRREWTRRKRLKDPAFARSESEKAREWQKANPIRNALNQYQQTANRKGRAWELSAEMFEWLVTSDCHYCGLKPEIMHGIDRINSEKGYTEDNVVTACGQCNYAKRNQPVEDFLNWVDRIATFRRGTNGHI
jgi:5-methylcytosine-specific restriction endonuclease McrA